MCDIKIETMIRDTVNGFVAKGYMFTAFDVTRFLRKAGESIRHGDVNDIVKSMYANSEMGQGLDQYQRDTKDLGKAVAPFVYYHPYTDVNNYVADWIDSNPSQNGMKNDNVAVTTPPLVTPVPLVSSVTPVASIAPVTLTAPVLPKGVRKVTTEGRLEVPLAEMIDAGLTSHDQVTVRKAGDVLEIESTKNSNYKGGGLTVYVNADGRLRISRFILNFVSSGDLFKIEVANGVITVSAYVAGTV